MEECRVSDTVLSVAPETRTVGEEKPAEKPRKVLIATLYSAQPIMVAATRLGPQCLILLTDKEMSKEQDDSLDLIRKSLGMAMEVKAVKTEVYDIVAVAEKCVELIDSLAKTDEIYVNITSGRKTKAIGLLLAAYARHDFVKKIAYNPEEDKTAVVYLPRLQFNLTESEKKVLEAVHSGKYPSLKDMADKLDISPAMVYRAVDELKKQDFIETDPLKLTDAGRIARL